MYYLRLYELYELQYGHEMGHVKMFLAIGVPVGLLNMVNRYYGYRVWR